MYEGDPFDGGDPKYEQPLQLIVINWTGYSYVYLTRDDQ